MRGEDSGVVGGGGRSHAHGGIVTMLFCFYCHQAGRSTPKRARQPRIAAHIVATNVRAANEVIKTGWRVVGAERKTWCLEWVQVPLSLL